MTVTIEIDGTFRDTIIASVDGPDTCLDEYGGVYRKFRYNGRWEWINVKSGTVLGPKLYDARPCNLEIKVT